VAWHPHPPELILPVIIYFLKNQQLDIISKVQSIVATNKIIDNNPLEIINNQLENLYKETKEIKKELSKLKDLTLS